MTQLKLQNRVVLEFDVNNGDFWVVNNDLLPFPLRDAIIDTRTDNSRHAFILDYKMVMDYLHNRSLSIHRSNAKAILNALKIAQASDDTTVTKMMILCKGLSASDDYWLSNSPNEQWENINVRDNPLHETLAQLSLYGHSPLTITGHIRTPELTGQGAYAKAWFREPDGLYLYKASSENNKESEIEVEVSNILDYTNVPHVNYSFVNKEGKRCCRCKNMATEHHGLVTATDVMLWCKHTEQSFDRLVLEQDAENYYKTLIVDYLVSNSDRHIQNWGFYMNNQTGNLICLHPLFDHNNAFDKADMEKDDGGESMMMQGHSKREAAIYAKKRCHIAIRYIPDTMFINKEHKESFMDRVKELGLINSLHV